MSTCCFFSNFLEFRKICNAFFIFFLKLARSNVSHFTTLTYTGPAMLKNIPASRCSCTTCSCRLLVRCRKHFVSLDRTRPTLPPLQLVSCFPLSALRDTRPRLLRLTQRQGHPPFTQTLTRAHPPCQPPSDWTFRKPRRLRSRAGRNPWGRGDHRRQWPAVPISPELRWPECS